MPHDGVADARLAVVRAHGNASDFGHAVFEGVQGATSVNAVVDAVDDVILKLLGNAFLRARHQVALRDVVLHDPEDIRDVLDVRRPDTRVLVRVHHGTVTPRAEDFLQHTALELTAQQVNAVRTRLAGMDGVHQVVHLRKVQDIGIEFQKFLRLVHVQSRNHARLGGFQVLGVLAGHKPLELDTVLVTDEEQLAHLHVLADFGRKFGGADVVGVPELVPADRRNDGHELLVQKLVEDVALDAFDPARPHVVHAVNDAEAPRQHPVTLDTAQAARREVAHDALGNAQRRLLDKGQCFFARKPHAVVELGFDFPSLELRVDTLARTRHDNDADTRLVQQGDISHEHREQGVVHQAVVNLQNEELALEPVHVTEDFPDESGDFEVLRVEIRRRLVHSTKLNKKRHPWGAVLQKTSPYYSGITSFYPSQASWHPSRAWRVRQPSGLPWRPRSSRVLRPGQTLLRQLRQAPPQERQQSYRQPEFR